MLSGVLTGRYIAFRSLAHNDDVTDGMWCAQNNVSVADLNEWKELKPDWSKMVLEQRRTKYAEQLMAVDQALIEKAQNGDTKAAELLYRRFENWTPKQADEALRKNPLQKTFAELVAEDAS